jgi:hypothetical protein
MSLTPAEAACVYAALILHDDGVEITVSQIVFLVKGTHHLTRLIK